MKRKLFVSACALLIVWETAWADSAIEAAQQELKAQGFYCGEIHGRKDADTTAAIRRYQIRNGLKITGELDVETQRSLGLTSKPAGTPATRPAHTPGPTPPGFLEETPAPRLRTTPAPRPSLPEPDEYDGAYHDEDEPVPESRGPARLQGGGLFDGTPYENAPPHVQQDIVIRAQLSLLQRGYYQDEIDGLYGPATNFALRNYQEQFGLTPNGRLDLETLASLRLLPEQRTGGFPRFHRRFFPLHPPFWPREPIYIPH